MTSETAALQIEISTFHTKLRILRTKLSGLTASRRLNLEELLASAATLEIERDELLFRLEPLRSGSVVPVSREERETLRLEIARWTKIAKVRKGIKKDMWDQIRDMAGEEAASIKVCLVYCGQ
jgi:26S proteasome regulatory subunit (ATPase 3-interacting protein)